MLIDGNPYQDLHNGSSSHGRYTIIAPRILFSLVMAAKASLRHKTHQRAIGAILLRLLKFTLPISISRITSQLNQKFWHITPLFRYVYAIKLTSESKLERGVRWKAKKSSHQLQRSKISWATLDRIRRSILASVSLCLLCQQSSESINHLFLEYSFSSQAWKKILQPFCK